jgi:hypothetical protein
MYREVTTTTHCEELQQDLKNLEAWEEKWQMAFHPDKCKVLRMNRKRKPLLYDYTIHGHVMESPPHEKYLGVTMSSNATWDQHINNTTNKATQTLGFLRRNLQSAPKSIKAMAYTTMVRPQLEYASTVWDPHQENHINQLEKVQRRAARFVNKNYSREASVLCTRQYFPLGGRGRATPRDFDICKKIVKFPTPGTVFCVKIPRVGTKFPVKIPLGRRRVRLIYI